MNASRGGRKGKRNAGAERMFSVRRSSRGYGTSVRWKFGGERGSSPSRRGYRWIEKRWGDFCASSTFQRTKIQSIENEYRRRVSSGRIKVLANSAIGRESEGYRAESAQLDRGLRSKDPASPESWSIEKKRRGRALHRARLARMETKRIARAIRRSWKGATKRRGVCWVYGFAALISVAVFVLFWCTNVFRDAILANLEIRNGTPTFLLWQRPPVGLVVKVYVFNYTNLAEFESGTASKLRVQQVGPYVYRETLSRVNVDVNANRTVTYQEKRSFQWISGKSEKEKVTVPNALLMSTIAYSRNLQYVAQIVLTMFLSGLQAKPFIELPVGEYLWGYEDQLFRMAKPFASFHHRMPYDKFGILVFKQGVNVDRITMHTGAGDLRNLGLIQRINGQEYGRIWGDDECDRINGTDGSMFPPHWLDQPNSTIYVYAQDLCRHLPFRYERRAFSNGIPTLRYKLPSDVFTPTRTADSCFCPKESHDSTTRRCPPAGTFNISACKFGTPLIVSFPHFYAGDRSLFQRIDGLTPNRVDHESYIDLHPRLGVTVDARMRIQLNLEVRKANGVPLSGNLEDGSILPLIWVDSGIDDVPESIQQIFHRGHYLANAIEAGFQWCSLIGAILSLGALIATLKQENCVNDNDDDDDDDSINAKPAYPLESKFAACNHIEVERS